MSTKNLCCVCVKCVSLFVWCGSKGASVVNRLRTNYMDVMYAIYHNQPGWLGKWGWWGKLSITLPKISFSAYLVCITRHCIVLNFILNEIHSLSLTWVNNWADFWMQNIRACCWLLLVTILFVSSTVCGENHNSHALAFRLQVLHVVTLSLPGMCTGYKRYQVYPVHTP